MLHLLFPRVGQENVLSLSGHELRFAVPILCPCVVPRTETGSRGLSDMEIAH